MGPHSSSNSPRAPMGGVGVSFMTQSLMADDESFRMCAQI